MSTTAQSMNAATAERLKKERTSEENKTEEKVDPIQNDLNQRTGNVQAKLKESDAQAKAPEKSFHQRQREAMTKDPGNFANTEAKKLGLERAKAFIASCMDPNDKNHDANYLKFKDHYGADARTATEKIIKDTVMELKSPEYEVQDKAYEDNLVKKFKPIENCTPEMAKTFSNFCVAISKKHFEVGYSGDASFIAELCDKYGVKPNDHLQHLKDIKIKE